MTIPPTSRRLAVLAAGILLAAGVAGKLIWWPAVIDPPTLDLARVDPAVRRLIDECLSEVRKNPRSAEAWGTLGIVLDINLFEQALPCFAQAERLDPDNPRWPHYQGIALLRSDPAAALLKFQRATQLVVGAASPSRLRLAELYLQLGRFDEARQEFDTLLKADANLPWALLGRARLDFHEGKLEQSRRQLKVPLANPTTTKAALLLSAEIYAREGKSAEARQNLAQATELPKAPDWPDPFVRETQKYHVGQAALLRQAETLCDQRRLPEATKLLQDVVHDYPESKASWTLLGWALMQQGRAADAEKALQTALQIDADAATPLVNLGTLRFNAKDNAGAKDYYRRAIGKKADSFEAHFNLGQCLKEEKDLPGAIAAIRQAVDCQPFNARAHALLGELLLEDHREDDAAFHLQEAITLNPNLHDAKTRLDVLRQKQARARP